MKIAKSLFFKSKHKNNLRFDFLLNKINRLLHSKKSCDCSHLVIYINAEDMEILRLQLGASSHLSNIYGVSLEIGDVKEPILKEVIPNTNDVKLELLSNLG